MSRRAWGVALALCLEADPARADPALEPGSPESLPAPEPRVFDSPFGREVAALGGPRLPWARGREAWSSQDGRYMGFFVPEQPVLLADDVEVRTLVIKSVDADAVVFQKVLYAEEEAMGWLDGSRRRLALSRISEVAPRWSAILYATGFPAVSVDGTQVAMVEPALEGEEGGFNLIVTVRPAETNEGVWRYDARSPKVRGGFQQLNERLAQTKWLPLRERPVAPVVAGRCQQAPDQQVRWGERQLFSHEGELRWKGSPKVMWKWDGIEAETPLDGGHAKAPACDARSRRFIDTAYTEDSTGVVLLRFATCGDTCCPETLGGYHVIKKH